MRESPEEKYKRMSIYEEEALSRGYLLCAGIDEAGRGPLAGPVVVAACILDREAPPILGLDDSKKCSEKKRDLLFDQIVDRSLAYAVVAVHADVIDDIGILVATKMAMLDCVDRLKILPDFLLVDAVKLDTDIPYNAIIKGDAKSNSIAAASILAKVSRDRMMEQYDSIYKGYGFAAHKGYGTKAHYAAIDALSVCPIHRKTFLKPYLPQE